MFSVDVATRDVPRLSHATNWSRLGTDMKFLLTQEKFTHFVGGQNLENAIHE